jgi:hypothetical protein
LDSYFCTNVDDFSFGRIATPHVGTAGHAGTVAWSTESLWGSAVT